MKGKPNRNGVFPVRTVSSIMKPKLTPDRTRLNWKHHSFWIALAAIGALLNGVGAVCVSAQEPADDVAAVQEPNKTASLIKVPLPLTAPVETRILASLESLANNTAGAERPVVVLEFVAANGAAEEDAAAPSLGSGTSFERALSLARMLSGPRGNRLRSIAYLPESLRGHAVLIALGCEEIAMHPMTEIGLAGLDESAPEATVLQAYLDIAARRGLFPPAAIRSMLDPAEPLVRLDLEGGGAEYTTLPELEKQARPENAWKETQLVPLNQMASFSGQELRGWRWITHLVNDRELLSSALKLDVPVQERPTFALPRKAMRMQLRGVLHNRLVNRTLRAIDESLQNDGTNLILIDLDSPGGSLEETLRLAYHLAEIPAERAEVVVFVSGRARGDAALIALAADSLFMAPNAVLGQAGEASISREDVDARKESFLRFAKTVGRFPGDVAGCVCPDVTVREYLAADGRRTRDVVGWLEDDAKLPLWKAGAEVDFREGLTADRAFQLNIASGTAPTLEAIGQRFGLEVLPQEKQTNRVEAAVEWLASQRWLSFLLFMIGIIALSAELNTPGLGIPGGIALVCFLLFFWLNLFQGTIEWLEVLLIGAGVLCLAAEIFLLPGFGVFGFLGLLLLAAGLVLASQTFVLPTNQYQWEKSVQGFGQLAFGLLVLMGLAFAFRKQLSNLPMVRWFALQPPLNDRFVVAMHELQEERRSLVGRYGSTLTRCNPYGKATFGDEVVDVVSQGDWLDEDSPIEVVSVQNNQILVKRRTI